jgi:hypothetical protein
MRKNSQTSLPEWAARYEKPLTTLYPLNIEEQASFFLLDLWYNSFRSCQSCWLSASRCPVSAYEMVVVGLSYQRARGPQVQCNWLASWPCCAAVLGPRQRGLNVQVGYVEGTHVESGYVEAGSCVWLTQSNFVAKVRRWPCVTCLLAEGCMSRTPKL